MQPYGRLALAIHDGQLICAESAPLTGSTQGELANCGFVKVHLVPRVVLAVQGLGLRLGQAVSFTASRVSKCLNLRKLRVFSSPRQLPERWLAAHLGQA